MTDKNDLFAPPPPTPFNTLSLGAGVQSSTMALMAAHGELTPTPDAAIFADTQAEPRHGRIFNPRDNTWIEGGVYGWLDWLEAEIQRCPHPFPLYRVTKGDLTKTALTPRERVKTQGKPWSKSLIPAYTLEPDGKKGHMQRACTYDYKLMPLLAEQKRIAGVKRGQKTCTVTSWIGISWDEVQRIRESQEPWCQYRYPLVELRMRRHQCIEWMQAKGYPKPPRSACVYCPYHSNAEWRRLRDEEPKEFARAVQFEKDLQAVKVATDNMRGVPFLHAARIPLDQVDFSTDEDRGQLSLFTNDCLGMCGV